MSPAIVPDTLSIRVATDDTDSGVNVAPFRAAIPPNTGQQSRRRHQLHAFSAVHNGITHKTVEASRGS